jgi:hypothetical protein
VTGERRQRATAMMVGEVDKRDTADAVKRFSPGVERRCGESSSTGRERTRPLNRNLEAAKMRREPVGTFNEEKKVRWGPVFGNG